jgi:hypothetical protein
LVIQNKKEPATETNPQQTLGFIKYVVCPFVIINVACIFTRFYKGKYCFFLSQIRIQKKRTTASKKHSSRSIHALLSIPFSQEDNSEDIKQVVSTWEKG